MKNIIFAILSLFAVQTINAQCGTDAYNQELINKETGRTDINYIDYLEAERDFEFETRVDKKTKKSIRTVPVVFHIIHGYGEENISKAQIEDQIRIINEDFQRLNADASSTRAIFQSRAASFDLEFKLARIAPNGSCTEGITRTYDPVNMYDNRESGIEEAKSAVAPWDRNKYLNIWIVKEILSSGTGTILGYAQFPGRLASTDGIVMIHNRVGTIGTARFSDKGRTLTHEIGHWLGLYHPFQGGCFGFGDGVEDTPPVAEPSYGCTAGQNPNTCTNDTEIDMVENYMDYANGGCMNAFTDGQRARAEGYLASLSSRGSTITAANLVATGVNTNPSCAPIADFWHTSDKLTICEGQSINFQDLSYNGTITSRTWTFEGGLPSTSGVESPTVTYNKAGIYKVELEVRNSQGTDKITRPLFISVTPAVAANKAPAGQNFENAAAVNLWQLETDNNDGWFLNTTLGFSGNRCLEARTSEQTPVGLRLSAISDPIDVSEYQGNLNLHFKYAYARRVAGSSERLLVLGSNDCGISWNILAVYLNATLETSAVAPNWKPATLSDWGRAEIDISRYAGSSNLYLRFDALSQAGNSIYLDDVNVGSFALNVKETLMEQNLYLLPNPAQNELTIQSVDLKGKMIVSIVDITGRLLLQRNLDSNTRAINTTELTNGVYTVWVEADNVRWAKKLIISK